MQGHEKAAPYRSRWRSAGIKIVACISHLQGKEIYVLARFTPFVEIGASTFIKACHIGVGTRSLYFRKTILGVIGQYSYNGVVYLCKADMKPCVWAPGTAGVWQWEAVV